MRLALTIATAALLAACSSDTKVEDTALTTPEAAKTAGALDATKAANPAKKKMKKKKVKAEVKKEAAPAEAAPTEKKEEEKK
ncbi:MAG: hypothetical protein KBD31_05560 [Proteobacteria bacterium]|nr:hypothetical protein [Pseudomonadota bacterium]